MKPWVLIDISYLAHRSRYATADLQWEDYHTGILFGFWEQLRTIYNDPHIRSNRILLSFDSRQSFRKQALPEYKAHRNVEMTEEEREQLYAMYDQINLLRGEILPAIGFRILRQTGCESDDLMAQAAIQIEKRGERAIIVTADGDLWQCITDQISWFDPLRRKFFDPRIFEKDKGIPPNEWRWVKALAGCHTDNVSGVPGVGEKTAIKFLLHRLPRHHKTHKAIESKAGVSIFNRNKELVVLPYPKTKSISLENPDYKVEVFFEYCKRYGFLSYLKDPKRSEWEAFFNGDQVKTRKRWERNGQAV